ncbi:MAG: hypothetical protein H6918_06685 [Sphingomonadaceae bacterium]|nr:hypothetical protein [Sphingomonadaceae bacterium]
MAERWIATDEAEDVAGSIRQALRIVHLLDEDEQAWKWLMLALHSALQGACVCHLVTTVVPVGCVTDKNASEWLQFIEARRKDTNATRPKTYLLDLPSLLKKVRKPNSAGDGSNSKGIALSDSDFAYLKSFHETYRNQFTHFAPMGWSIEVSGVSEIARLISRVIGEILDCGWAFRNLDLDMRSRLRADLDALAKM